LPVGSPL